MLHTRMCSNWFYFCYEKYIPMKVLWLSLNFASILSCFVIIRIILGGVSLTTKHVQ